MNDNQVTPAERQMPPTTDVGDEPLWLEAARREPINLATRADGLPAGVGGILVTEMLTTIALLPTPPPLRRELSRRGGLRCDGSGCDMLDATKSARSYLFASLEPEDRVLLDDVVPAFSDQAHPTSQRMLVDSGDCLVRAVIVACEAPSLLLTDEPLDELLPHYVGRSVADGILGAVERAEHAAHRFGYRMTSRQGSTLAKYWLARLMFFVTIFAQGSSVEGFAHTIPADDVCANEQLSWAETFVPTLLDVVVGLLTFSTSWYALPLLFSVTIVGIAARPELRDICDWTLELPLLVWEVFRTSTSVVLGLPARAWSRHPAVVVGTLLSAIVPTVRQCIVAQYWSFTSSCEEDGWGFCRLLCAPAVVCWVLQFFCAACLVLEFVSLVRRFVAALCTTVLRGLESIRSHLLRRYSSATNSEAKAGDYKPGISSVMIRGFPTNEMAMNGSAFSNTVRVPPLLSILKWNDVEGVYEHKGFGFRYRGYLVTAFHVMDGVIQAPGKTYIAKVKAGSRRLEVDLPGAREVDEITSIIPDIDESCDSLSWGSDNDVWIMEMPKNFFAEMGVASAVFTTAAYSAPVSTFGYFPPEVKMANGLVLKADPGPKIHYSSSTRDGSSGSPVMVGSKVLALHQGHDGKSNFGLAGCVISVLVELYERKKLCMKPEASNNVYEDKVHGVYRDSRGSVVEVIEGDFGVTMVDSRGRVQALARDEILDYHQHLSSLDPDGFRFGESGALKIDPVNNYSSTGTPPTTVGYDDDRENISSPAVVDQPAPVGKVSTPRRDKQFNLTSTPLKECLDKEKVLRTPSFKGYNKEVLGKLDQEELKELGYEPGTFAFPDASGGNAAVAKAFQYQADQLRKSVNACEAPPDDVRAAAMRFVVDKLRPAAYQMKKDPLSDEKISNILNSSLIKDGKSPGRFFMANGMTTNQLVMRKYTNKQIAEMVRSLGPVPEDVNMFPKIDAQKRAKLAERGPRLVFGMDVRETTLANCYFSEFNVALSTNYRKTGLAIGWSPIKAGDAEWLVKTHFGNTKKQKCKNFVGTDIKGLDWTYNEWFINDAADMVVALARPAPGMTTEEEDEWRDAARAVIIRQFTMPMVLPDGTRVLRINPAVMSSGSVLTLALNSIVCLYLDTCAKLEMDYSYQDLSALFKTIFGGDDGMQSTPDGFNLSDYVDRLASYGLTVHDLESKPHISGCEFFSWRFEETPLGLTFVPTRFTKHVEHLKATPTADLAQTLVSHMSNWVHSPKHFKFFENVYLSFREGREDDFPLSYPTRRDILSKLNGLEIAQARS